MPENLREALRALKRAQASSPSAGPLQWAGFREVRETTSSRFIRDGKPQDNSTFVSHGVMAEVLVDGQFGYAATPRTDAESLMAAIERARAQALRASKWAIHRFTPQQRPVVNIQYQSQLIRPFSAVSPREINEVLVEITRRLKRSPKILRTQAYADITSTEVHFVSTNGSDAAQEFTFISSGFDVTARESGPKGEIVQRRSSEGFRGKSLQGGWEHFHTPDLWERVERVAEEALELLAAPECPTETLPLLLLPDQMMLQIHESIGHPLELDRILGDERNFAGWSFVKTSDFGRLQYGSPIMNVTFDPTVSSELASYAFDDTGNPASREYLVKDGILKTALGGLESQTRSGVPGVANMRACSWNRAPIDRMANINLEPGDSSLEEMISSVERGVLMTSNRSWSIDDFRNKFQFGCEYGRMIENGRLTHAVRNPNYRGVTVPFWRSLKKVGNPDTRGIFGTPNCGKGEPNQLIRVGHASPACLFEGVEVFGGAS